MESRFKKGDVVRARRSVLARLLHLPISRSEIMVVQDIHEVQYVGDNYKSLGVIVRDLDGKELHFFQDNLEKI